MQHTSIWRYSGNGILNGVLRGRSLRCDSAGVALRVPACSGWDQYKIEDQAWCTLYKRIVTVFDRFGVILDPEHNQIG